MNLLLLKHFCPANMQVQIWISISGALELEFMSQRNKCGIDLCFSKSTIV